MGKSAGAPSRKPTRQGTSAEHTRTPTTECCKVVCGMLDENKYFVEIATRFQASLWPSRTFVKHEGGRGVEPPVPAGTKGDP